MPLSFVNRVLYHQLYRASSHRVACSKKPISLWMKWINIPSACLFLHWLLRHIDSFKLVIYSTQFICKAGVHLFVFVLLLCLEYPMMNATVAYWLLSLPWCLLNRVKRANEKWKLCLCISLRPYVRLMKGLKLDSVLWSKYYLQAEQTVSPKSICLYLGCSQPFLAFRMSY